MFWFLCTLLLIFCVAYLIWAVTEPHDPQAKVREWILRSCMRLLCLFVLAFSWVIFPTILLLSWDTWEKAWKQDWKSNLKDSYAGLFAVMRRGHL